MKGDERDIEDGKFSSGRVMDSVRWLCGILLGICAQSSF
jgi:hypothetical protein